MPASQDGSSRRCRSWPGPVRETRRRSTTSSRGLHRRCVAGPAAACPGRPAIWPIPPDLVQEALVSTFRNLKRLRASGRRRLPGLPPPGRHESYSGRTAQDAASAGGDGGRYGPAGHVEPRHSRWPSARSRSSDTRRHWAGSPRRAGGDHRARGAGTDVHRDCGSDGTEHRQRARAWPWRGRWYASRRRWVSADNRLVDLAAAVGDGCPSTGFGSQQESDARIGPGDPASAPGGANRLGPHSRVPREVLVVLAIIEWERRRLRQRRANPGRRGDRWWSASASVEAPTATCTPRGTSGSIAPWR